MYEDVNSFIIAQNIGKRTEYRGAKFLHRIFINQNYVISQEIHCNPQGIY